MSGTKMERVEARAERKKKEEKSSFFSEAVRIFTLIELVVYPIMYFTLNFVLFYILMKDVSYSLLMGMVGMVFFFSVYTYKNRKLKVYQDHLQDLLKYVNNVVFYLTSGENLFYALESTKGTVSPEIDDGIKQTLSVLEKEARLETGHFQKYHFPGVDQFHQNLQVYYDRGGDPKELFYLIQQNMVAELGCRDDLYRKRRVFRFNVMTMLMMVGISPLILRFMTTELWELFLEYNLISIMVVTGTYMMFLANIYLIQKHATDISVRI
ncbi:hypothetical protein [Pseudobacillus badius]|uniref:hypothetical protein n=1 Tax=Bacillus badius TaxID=1455 RepID=UPI001CBFF54A|nr:hypothetical protein [Bacillus badius]UAT32405.1 hypothetical protein K7T73_09430 [Bacillus badius]GLY12878.1 hypothetical protein Bbad01_40940 [Bacillus badius]